MSQQSNEGEPQNNQGDNISDEMQDLEEENCKNVFVFPIYTDTRKFDEGSSVKISKETTIVNLLSKNARKERCNFLARKIEDEDLYEQVRDGDYLFTIPKYTAGSKKQSDNASSSDSSKKKSKRDSVQSPIFIGQFCFSQSEQGPKLSIVQANADTIRTLRRRIDGLTINQTNHNASGQGAISQVTGGEVNQYFVSDKDKLCKEIAEHVKEAFYNSLNELEREEQLSTEKIVASLIKNLKNTRLSTLEDYIDCAKGLVETIFDKDSGETIISQIDQSFAALSKSDQYKNILLAVDKLEKNQEELRKEIRQDVKQEMEQGFERLLAAIIKNNNNNNNTGNLNGDGKN